MQEERKQSLLDFVAWVRAHVRGDEKGEAQIFLDRLLQAFGHKGCLEVGGQPEYRIRKAHEDGGGTAFADYVWKPFVLIEMKKRGEDLSRHYRQAFDYWTRLVPGRPRYVVLCNFDAFWVYDFETQMDVPVDQLTLDELPERYGPLAFLFPSHERPIFGNDHEQVTRESADLLATCFNKLIARNVPRATAQRFVLQMLVALFAEDIDLLEKYFVTRLLDECKAPADSYDLLGGLFEAMNTPGGVTGGRFKGVDYFNGGLFREPARLELYEDELNQLRQAAEKNWSKVRPEIFGTLFEHSMGEESGERRAYGAHFTNAKDIMKIVGPTIVEPWRGRIEDATTLPQLEKLRARMQSYRVLDPACGSGNFLYIAYRELKRLEKRLFERIEQRKKVEKGQRQIGFVTAAQFYGIDINPFAVEIAKVTMMIARKLAIDELHVDERALPLDNLDQNFVAGDALVTPVGAGGDALPTMLFAELEQDPWRSGRVVPTKWPAADVIIGNPPFVGSKLLKPQRGADYVNAVRKTYPAVPGMADYCVYWLRKAHDHLPPCTPDDPLRGRAGLVGTQNVRNNKSREGGLDYIVRSGTIVEAVDNQPWSGEANVHVSIVNWVKHVAQPPSAVQRPAALRAAAPAEQNPDRKGGALSVGADRKGKRSERQPAGAGAFGRRVDVSEPAVDEAALLIPRPRKLWFKVDPPPERKRIRKRAKTPAAKEYELSYRECVHINSALSHHIDVSGKRALRCNQKPKRCFQGKIPGYDGFLIDAELKGQLRDSEVISPYLTGRELLDELSIERWAIDFRDSDVLTASAHRAAFGHVQQNVLPAVEKAYERAVREGSDMVEARREHLNRWWQFWNRRDELNRALDRLSRYIGCSRVTRRPIMAFLSTQICPSDLIQVFALDDDYSFGILQSAPHFLWFQKSSRLKVETDLRYSVRSIFDTFPWPQSPTVAQVRAVAEAGRQVRRVRAEALEKMSGGLRALYRTLELPGRSPLKDAHAALDAAVLEAYGFARGGDLLGQLLELNLAVAARIEAGEAVTGPGVPEGYAGAGELVTDDCIRPVDGAR
jgi:SAM-dependent methyltransferase